MLLCLLFNFFYFWVQGFRFFSVHFLIYCVEYDMLQSESYSQTRLGMLL